MFKLTTKTAKQPLLKKCPYSKLFWSVLSRIRSEYAEMLYLSVFSPNAGKCGPEQRRIRTLFAQY